LCAASPDTIGDWQDHAYAGAEPEEGRWQVPKSNSTTVPYCCDLRRKVINQCWRFSTHPLRTAMRDRYVRWCERTPSVSGGAVLGGRSRFSWKILNQWIFIGFRRKLQIQYFFRNISMKFSFSAQTWFEFSKFSATFLATFHYFHFSVAFTDFLITLPQTWFIFQSFSTDIYFLHNLV
jgi:hypothetical protein